MLAAAIEDLPAVVEFLQCLRRKNVGAVVDSLVVVCLVNGNGCVDYLWSHSLLLDDRLDVLVHVVVSVLALSNRRSGSSVSCVVRGARVLELGSFAFEMRVDFLVVSVMEFLVLNRSSSVCVLLGTGSCPIRLTFKIYYRKQLLTELPCA